MTPKPDQTHPLLSVRKDNECREVDSLREPGAHLIGGHQSGNPKCSGHYLTVRR